MTILTTLALAAAAAYPTPPSAMACKVDEFQQMRFCTSRGARGAGEGTHLVLYTAEGERRSTAYARMELYYIGDGWLFAESVQFIVDGRVLPALPLPFKRDTMRGGVLEHADVTCDASCILLLKTLATSKTAKMRISGRTASKDVTISPTTKQHLQRALDYLAFLLK